MAYGRGSGKSAWSIGPIRGGVTYTKWERALPMPEVTERVETDMANATARVGKTYRDYRFDHRRRSYATLTSQLQLYVNAMVGYNSSNYMTKFDDTAALRFGGLILDSSMMSGSSGPKLPNNGAVSGTQGDGTLDFDFIQPVAFELTITSVAISDIGRRVYALDDQTGTLDPSATTYANQIGTVEDVVYATNPASAVSNIALVRAIYSNPNGGQIAAIYAASGAMLVKPGLHVIIKTSGAAMTLAAPTAGTHDGMAIEITSDTAFAHTVTCPGSIFKNGGAAATAFAFTGTTSGGGVTLRAYNGTWKVVSSTGGAFS